MTDALSEIRRPISYMSEHSNITDWNAKIKNNIDWVVVCFTKTLFPKKK